MYFIVWAFGKHWIKIHVKCIFVSRIVSCFHHCCWHWQWGNHAFAKGMIATGSRIIATALLWRHNGCGGVSNQQPHDCLLNHFCRRRSNETSKLRVTGLCAGNSPGTGEFPAQMASNVENVFNFMTSSWPPKECCVRPQQIVSKFKLCVYLMGFTMQQEEKLLKRHMPGTD